VKSVEYGHNSDRPRTGRYGRRSPFGRDTVESETMADPIRLPDVFPENTKYVLEACGPLVRRYVVFPDGRRLELAPGKALTCRCLALRESEPIKRVLSAA
jgi:hypothetical protein